jgi:quercetin dioxygenase-like cupin family protein
VVWKLRWALHVDYLAYHCTALCEAWQAQLPKEEGNMHTSFTRPFEPAELTSKTMEAFNLNALARQLMTETPFTEHSRNGLTLVRGDDLTMVLTVAKAGKVVQEHSAVGPTAILVLEGVITLTATGDGTGQSLEQGMAAALAPDLLHVVEAHTDSVFLIVIGGKDT